MVGFCILFDFFVCMRTQSSHQQIKCFYEVAVFQLVSGTDMSRFEKSFTGQWGTYVPLFLENR